MLSGRFDADNYPALGAILAGLGVGQAQFFVNSVNTRTKGVDLTVSHKADLGGARLATYLGVNYSKTDVTSINPPSALAGFEDVLLSERERLFIEQGGPRSKAVLGFDLATGRLETQPEDHLLRHADAGDVLRHGRRRPQREIRSEDLGRPRLHLELRPRHQAHHRRREHLQREADEPGPERDRQRLQVRQRAVRSERDVVLRAALEEVLRPTRP